MRKKLAAVMIAAGALLMLSAAVLFCRNSAEDAKAGDGSAAAMEEIERYMNKESVNDTDSGEAPETGGHSLELPVVQLDTISCIGYISLHDLGIELPVADEWSYYSLMTSPCRQMGSPVTDDLVIAAHNYQAHFGRLGELQVGSKISFTDMNGIENIYYVQKTETIDPDQLALELLDDYDLTVYTCNYSGNARIAVFCDRPENIGKKIHY